MVMVMTMMIMMMMTRKKNKMMMVIMVFNATNQLRGIRTRWIITFNLKDPSRFRLRDAIIRTSAAII